MKPGAPWSIKGVEPDARDTAKAKAQAAGMTLGQWLNRIIEEADKPRPVPVPQPQPGSALDTARIMRAVAEVARRVDLLREGEGDGSAPAAPGRIEARLDEVVRRLDEIDAREPAPVDLTGLETRLAALDGRLEHLAMHPAGQGGTGELRQALAEQAADLRRIMTGLLNLSRKVEMVESGLEEKLNGLKAEVAALQAEIQASSAAVDEALAPLRAELATAPLEPFGFEATDEGDDAPPAAAADEAAEWTVPEEAPQPPSPEMAAALYDLTSGRDVRTGPRLGEGNPIFRDLPPFEPAEEPSPTVGIKAEPETEEAAADELPVIDLAEVAIPLEPDEAAATTSYSRDEDPAEPPSRAVAVESLIAGDDVPKTEKPAPERMDEEEDDEFGWQPVGGGEADPRLDRLDAPTADRPYVGAEAEAAESEARRQPVGYALAALLFLVLLVGGYVLIGSERFDTIATEARRLWAEVATPTGEQLPVPVEPTTNEAAPAATSAPQESVPGPSESQTAAPAAPAPEAEPTGTEDTAPATETAPAGDAAAAAPTREAEAAVPAPPAPATPPGPFEELRARAEGGDSEAQYRLGLSYRDGHDVGASFAEAATWFDRAAQRGHVEAQVNLGTMYRQGVGVPQDVELAKVWLHEAARAGHPQAQKYLGEIYAADDLGLPDFFQAARWFREAAEQGVVDAQYNMGVLYEGGHGVPRDNAQAYYWFGLAAAQGDEPAAESRARIAESVRPEERAEQDERIAAFQPEPQWPDDRPAAAAAVPALPPAPAETSPVGSEAELTRRDLIGELQRLLIDRGYDPGPADGLPGERTRDAIRQFQSDRGLPISGQISAEALTQLRDDR